MNEPSYHGLPLLKGPVWTWEVPVYFFIGGTAGVSALLAIAAGSSGAVELARDARRIAAAGSLLSGPLLVSDLGRPARFLNMLRVFKPQSPMSVGVWTLLAFTSSSALAAAADLPRRRSLPVRLAGGTCGLASAATGMVMATYTGVLIGATAIPVWKQHVRLLPSLFASSSLGSAASLLELRGHRHPALNGLALGAAIFETLVTFAIDGEKSAASRPLHTGRSGNLVRLGAMMSGPVPFALRLAGARKAAAAASVIGSLFTRFGWVAAGKASARDAGVAL